MSGTLKRAKDGSTLKRKFKAANLRSMLADMKAGIAIGKTDSELCEQLQVSVATYNNLKNELLRQETARLYAQTTEEVFLEYSWKQGQCIIELDHMLERLSKNKQYNALVGAVRAKSDIIDKIVKMGQDMGVLEKAPERKMILHGVAVTNLDNNGLRKVIATELSGLAMIMNKFGDLDIMGRPLAPKGEALPAMPSAMQPAGPKFSDKGSPAIAKGGKSKAAGGAAARTVTRVKSVAPSHP